MINPILAASLAISLLLVFKFVQACIRVFRSPLSSIPGPRLSLWTGILVEYHWLKGNRPRYVHSLHQKYGPIVRVSPTEVDITDISAVRTIHKIGGGFLKSKFYRDLVANVTENVFSTTDPAFHSYYRRLLSAPMSDAYLRTIEPQIWKSIRLAMQRIQDEAKLRGATDIYKWWSFLTTDIIGELSFGDSFRMLELGKKDQYALDLEQVAVLGGIRATFPTLMGIARRSPIPLPMFQQAVSANQRLAKYADESIQRYKTLVAADPLTSKRTLFTKLFQAGEEGMPDEQVSANAQAYIIAGSDTTANTLTYLVWSVCRQPDIKSRLLQELSSLPDDFQDQDLRNLQYLQQVINETLRLYSAAPSALPRVVPPGGANMAGYWLPEGATVSTQAYSLHRDPAIFPDPERFNPSRWAEPNHLMRDAFMPFGGGSRICLGLNLAMMELRGATAHFFRSFPNCKVSKNEGMTDDDMEALIYFLLVPRGKRCLIQLT